MRILERVVLPALAAGGVVGFQAALIPQEVVVPCELNAYTGTRTFVRVIAPDETDNLKLWADICAVTKPRRVSMLELLNRLNREVRWLKFSLADAVVVLEMDLALGDSGHPQEHFREAFAGFMQVLYQHWAEIVRLATRRGRRSRLEREVEGLLARQAAAGGE